MQLHVPEVFFFIMSIYSVALTVNHNTLSDFAHAKVIKIVTIEDAFFMQTVIKKRDGRLVRFNAEKITNAIKAYIIYHDQYARLREMANKMEVDLVDQYLQKHDGKIHENSNMDINVRGFYMSSEKACQKHPLC